MKFIYTSLILLFLNTFTSAQTTYWWNNSVFYEIFVRSFYDSDGNGIGDFKGLTSKLDYLNELGVNAIWLMPIMDSPSYHGYDVSDYRKIEPDYGTNADFLAFIDSAHARGIRVIVDLVLNHSSSQNPWFQDSRSSVSSAKRNWYRWSQTNPGSGWHSYGGYYYYGIFSSGMPDLNYFEPAVKTEIFSVSKYWLETMKVDGFRLDAAKFICEEGTTTENAPSTFQFWKDFRSAIKSSKSDAYSVGEVWSNTASVLPYVNGTGLDMCFEFDLAGSIISCINNGNPSGLLTHLKDNVTAKYPFLQYATFLSNHDQQRVFSQFGVNTTKAKLAASVLMTLPGVPYLYYGEEVGMTSATDDPSKRTPMQWTSGTNSGFTTGSPWKSVNANYSTNNVSTMRADSTSLFSIYKKMIKLRKDNPSFLTGGYYPVNVTTPGAFVFIRYKSGSDIIIPVHNFTSTWLTNPSFNRTGFAGLPVGSYKLIDMLTNADCGNFVINGDGSINCTTSLTLPQWGSAILKAVKVTDVKETINPQGYLLEQNYPNPFNPNTSIGFQLASSGNVKLTVFNTLGQEVKILVNGEMEKGFHKVEFNASDLNSGAYFYKIQSGSFTETRKMLVLK